MKGSNFYTVSRNCQDIQQQQNINKINKLTEDRQNKIHLLHGLNICLPQAYGKKFVKTNIFLELIKLYIYQNSLKS